MHAYKITVAGRVQGVGFRPYVYILAKKYTLCGEVKNTVFGVLIHVEGLQVDAFIQNLPRDLPRLARIDKMNIENVKVENFSDFSIAESDRGSATTIAIPVDASSCHKCISELNLKNNRRYKYPFINCTECGPRYTIIAHLPYDRPHTAAHKFKLCSECLEEYKSPLDRRYHAQPIACYNCGPRLKLVAHDGKTIVTKDHILSVRQLLKKGNIISIKGIGGYHLCCDAYNIEAVRKLRASKRRLRKPFALMTKSIATIKTFAHVNLKEEELLQSPEAPIVLLEKLSNKKGIWLDEVAPNLLTVGVMLPYTPLHHLLLDEETLPCIVATSSNLSGFPIMYNDEEALKNEVKIADYILSHDRDILYPVDDSLVQLSGHSVSLLRRARGYVPDTLPLSFNANGIVALGSEMKNTFALGRNNEVIVGPHIGDLNTYEIEQHYLQQLQHLTTLLNVTYDTVALDRHPTYTTRKLLKDFKFKRVIEVNHHHAHMAGCMEENSLSDNCYGIILDGTGYGDDGHIWGFEILFGNRKEFKRVAHLEYTPLVGGDKVIREPWRMAVCMLLSQDVHVGFELALILFPQEKDKILLLRNIFQKGLKKFPYVGSCGRLYDAVSAILGLCPYSSYDGEAAVLVEEIALEQTKIYSFHWENDVLSIKDLIFEIVRDKLNNIEPEIIAGRFQATVIEAIITKFNELPRSNVVLSGGSFYNKFLLKNLSEKLTSCGFTVYHHKHIPPGDGGLSYGQLVVAAQHMEE